MCGPLARWTAAGISGYVLLYYYRRDFLRYAIAVAVWLSAFATYLRLVFGQFLPDYYREGSFLSLMRFRTALPAILFSPARGLFVFVPSTLIVVYLVIRYWRALPHRRLAVLAAAIIVGNVLVVATWIVWWGGRGYGPRLLTDVVPSFVILAVLGLRALSNARDRAPGRLESRIVLAVAVTLVAVSIAINGWGAVSLRTVWWMDWHNFDLHPGAMWDWRSPLFLAGLTGR